MPIDLPRHTNCRYILTQFKTTFVSECHSTDTRKKSSSANSFILIFSTLINCDTFYGFPENSTRTESIHTGRHSNKVFIIFFCSSLNSPISDKNLREISFSETIFLSIRILAKKKSDVFIFRNELIFKTQNSFGFRHELESFDQMLLSAVIKLMEQHFM